MWWIANMRHGLLIILVLLLVPEIAFALDRDFYTYNTFTETVDALKRTALIFGDSTYKFLFPTVAILGIIISYIVTYSKGIMGEKIKPLALAVPILAGAMVYQGFILKTGNVAVYDKTVNSTETVAGIPDGLVLTAWLLNRMEYYVINILDTNTANVWNKYQGQAGGISFQLLDTASRSFNDLDDSYLTRSIRGYIEDCGTLSLGSGVVDINELRRNTHSLQSTIAKFSSKSINTVYYSSADKNGTLMSCESAWNNINGILNAPTNIDPMINNVCARSGFDINHTVYGANQKTVCKGLLANAASLQGNAAGTPEGMMKNLYLAQVLLDTVSNGNVDIGTSMLTNRNAMVKAVSVSQSINEWMPRIRGFMLTVILVLIPIAALFIVTPLLGKVLLITGAMMVWYTLWSVIDAAMHQSAMDVAYRAFEQIAHYKSGLDSVYLLPENSVQALGVFGVARLVAFGLAGLFTTFLFKVSVGYALSSAATKPLEKIETTAEEASLRSATVEGQGEMVRGMTGGAATLSNYATHGFQSMASANAYHDSTSISSASQQIAGGTDRGKTLHETAQTVGMLQAGQTLGNMDATTTLAGMYGKNQPGEIREFTAGIENTSSLRNMVGTQAYRSSMERQFPETKDNPEYYAERVFQTELYNNYDRLSRANSIGQAMATMEDLMLQRGVDHDLAQQTTNERFQYLYHNDYQAKGAAYDWSGSDALSVNTFQQRKSANQTLAEKETLGQSADEVHLNLGKHTAAQEIGTSTAVDNNQLSDIASAQDHRITAEAEQGKVFTQWGNNHFDGDHNRMHHDIAQGKTAADVAYEKRNQFIADMFFAGDLQTAASSRNEIGGYHVPTDKLLSAMDAHPEKFNDMTPTQRDLIQRQDNVNLDMAFNPETGQVSNVRLFGGSQAMISASSEYDSRNEFRSGLQTDALSMSNFLLSDNPQHKDDVRVMMAQAYDSETKQASLHNVASNWASALRLQAESTSTTLNTASAQAGIDLNSPKGGKSKSTTLNTAPAQSGIDLNSPKGGKSKEDIPLNALQIISKVAGIGAGVEIGKQWNDNISYDQFVSSLSTKLDAYDATARSFANETATDKNEAREIYAASMASQVKQEHNRITRELHEGAVDSMTNSPLSNVMEGEPTRAENSKLDNSSGRVQRR